MAGAAARNAKGMDAMGTRRQYGRLARLWQVPLLLLSLALFGVAAYLFFDIKPGLTIEQKIEVARTYMKQERPDAARGYLNKLLGSEKLTGEQEGTIHLMLAESLEVSQRQRKINVLENHERIIEQSRMAIELGVKADADAHRRMGESYEALDRPADAIANYRQAAVLDHGRWVRMQRKIIELQLRQDDKAAASVGLGEDLGRSELADAERAWAKGEMAHVLIDRDNFSEARRLLAEVLRLDPSEPAHQGPAYYWLGYCAYKLGQMEDAERHLRAARDLLRVKHPLDADAAYLLGRILQQKGDAAAAILYYDAVLESHLDARVAPLARLYRGAARVSIGEHDAGLSDLHDVVAYLSQKDSRKERYRDETVSALRMASGVLAEKQNHQGALEVMTYEQQLVEKPPAAFFERLGGIYERRAEQLERGLAEGRPAERARREQQVREFRTKAGDAFIALSRAQTVENDVAYGEALWKGVQLYNKCGDVQRVIAALEMFVGERPEDAMAPDALLQLGQAFQAAGMLDKSIGAFHRAQFRYPNSLAAVKSAIPMAQAYVAKGPEYVGKAEAALRGVVENNPAVTPEAAEFKQALFELAQLYYRGGRYEEAIGKLEELVQRYPAEERMGQLVFLMGDSYRRSSAALDAKLAALQGGDVVQQVDRAEALTAKRDRLGRARQLYDKAIELYKTAPPSADLERLYNKLAHFYRADCVFELGEYVEAIKLYDHAAFRYQDDPSALAAYVQIVNANCALGRMAEAKAANERAKWLLRRMPAEAFANGTFSMPRKYWEDWLRWSGETGWRPEAAGPATRPAGTMAGRG